MEQPVISQDSAVTEAPAADIPADLIEADLDRALVDQIAAPEQEADEAEEELDGLKVKGKKDQIERLKAERMMQADYTRKTQAIAQERQQLQQYAQQQQQFLDKAATLRAIDIRLAEFDKVDLRALIDSDPAQAQKLQLERGELAQARGKVAQSIQADQAHTFQQQQAGLASLKEQAAAYLTKQIPNWTPERDAAIAKYVLDSGVPAEAISNVMAHMPQFGVMAHKAELYDALVAKATKKTQPQPQEAPVTRVAATRATANKTPDQMSDAEYAKWRHNQIRQRR